MAYRKAHQEGKFDSDMKEIKELGEHFRQRDK